jgi:hypothetical protein
MRRVIAGACVVALLLAAGAARADLKEGATLLTLSGSYTYMKNAPSEQMNSGTGGVFTLEKVQGTDSWSFGGLFAAMNTEEDYTGPNGQDIHGKYDQLLMELMGRYYLGIFSAVDAYAGVGLGFRFATYTITTDGVPVEDSESNLGISMPVGIYVGITRSFYLNLGYSFNYLSSSSFLYNDMAHGFHAGIGWQFGGGGDETEAGAEPAAAEGTP